MEKNEKITIKSPETEDFNIGGNMDTSGMNKKQLLEFLQKRLEKEDAKELADSMMKDSRLQVILKGLKSVSEEDTSINWKELKSPAQSIFKQLFRDINKSRKRGNAKLAVRIFDSKSLPLPEGVRPATIDTRRIKYVVDDTVVELSLYPVSPNSYEIIGQISEEAEAQNLVITVSSGEFEESVEVNECGVFRFARLRPGIYSAVITKAKSVLVKLEIDV